MKLTTLITLSTLCVGSTMAATPSYITDCFDCHGKQGVSSEKDVPTIAGMSATFIEASLFAYIDDVRPAISGHYRAGDLKRPDTDMKKISKALKESQIKEIAAYFSEQPFVAAKQAFDASQAALGKQIHAMKCAKCHDEGGSIADDDAGILSGQWRQYLKQSFTDMRDKSRPSDKKMIKLVADLSDAEIDALLDYYASNKP